MPLVNVRVIEGVFSDSQKRPTIPSRAAMGVKTTIFYANVEDFATINAIYAGFMPDPPPARSASANVILPPGLLISIDAIAALPPHRSPRAALSASMTGPH